MEEVAEDGGGPRPREILPGGARPTVTPDPLDEFLPEWDVAERHEIRVGASPAVTYRCLRSVDLGRSRVIRTLFRLRGMRPTR